MSSLDASNVEPAPNSGENSAPAVANSGTKPARGANLAQYRMKPGETRNPNGRPKRDLDLAAKARAHAAKALATCVAVMNDPKASAAVRLNAAAEILDRGFGRAPQSLNIQHTLTIGEEFDRFVRSLQGLEQRDAVGNNNGARLIEHGADVVDVEPVPADGVSDNPAL